MSAFAIAESARAGRRDEKFASWRRAAADRDGRVPERRARLSGAGATTVGAGRTGQWRPPPPTRGTFGASATRRRERQRSLTRHSFHRPPRSYAFPFCRRNTTSGRRLGRCAWRGSRVRRPIPVGGVQPRNWGDQLGLPLPRWHG